MKLSTGSVTRCVMLVAGVFGLAGLLLWEWLIPGTEIRSDRELRQICSEYSRQAGELAKLRRSATEAEVEAASERFDGWQCEARLRCLEIAAENPGTMAEALALLSVAGYWPDSEEADSARDRLLKAAFTVNISDWARALDHHFPNNDIQQSRAVVAQLILRVEREPDHPDAAWLLCEAGNLVAPDSDAESIPEEFTIIGDLIRDRYAASFGLANFCEQVGGIDGSAPEWGREFESHVRRILEVNEDRWVRCSAKFALASIVRSGGAQRQPEAKQLFEEFLHEFDAETKYHAQSIELHYRQASQRILQAIRDVGLGVPAPATVGVDLDGRPMSLSDYRGKIVLLSFWATWCHPCLKAIPHEKELLEHFGSRAFAIVGVNADQKLALARQAVTKHGISWRSFQVQREDDSSIADDWHIAGYPTFYLLDTDGVVVSTWLGTPPRSELNEKIGALIAKAEGREYRDPTVDHPGENIVNDDEAEQIPVEVVNDNSGANGFVSRGFMLSNGDESRYVVFLPRGYDQSHRYPAIVFLHGAGAQGTDGRRQLTAFAPSINRRKDSFPFIVVFPQAPSGDWHPETGQGDLAMAVLDDVMRVYSVDPDRVALTGVSMGGEGTWSLAAAYPDRWSAIVPLCGSGDPTIVERFAHIPCWCFQGGADRSTYPERSRAMVRGLRIAGGQPIYTEYPGVGHNCWDRAYDSEDLFEWLITQRRSSRSMDSPP